MTTLIQFIGPQCTGKSTFPPVRGCTSSSLVLRDEEGRAGDRTHTGAS